MASSTPTSRPWPMVLLGAICLLVALILAGEGRVLPDVERQGAEEQTLTEDRAGDQPLTPTPRPTRRALGLAAGTATATTATAPVLATPKLAATPTRPAARIAVPSQVTATPAYRRHVVESGETLIAIALTYDVSVEAIMEANDLGDPHLLQIGRELQIPPPLAPRAVPFAGGNYGYEIIGFSWEGRAIEVFSFGNGPRHVVLVGGIHGGYEWNTVLLAYQMIDYFNGYRGDIPQDLTVNIIPVANPDGLARITGGAGRFDPNQIGGDTRPGRFNGRGVDLNRNWGCHWSASAYWGPTAVDPGSGPFSEPETRALRAYLERISPLSVVFWHSAFNLVSPGLCGDDNGQAANLAHTYGAAAGYPVGSFDAYDVTGGASDYLVSQGVPAIAVELSEHHLADFQKNAAGVAAVLRSYGPALEE